MKKKKEWDVDKFNFLLNIINIFNNLININYDDDDNNNNIIIIIIYFYNIKRY